MVGVVIVSHSQHLAESIKEYTALMAGDAHVAAAGGNEDGSFGTSFQKIYDAVAEVDSEDGVLVLMDMGSAVMTTEMVLEAYGSDRVEMVDCPIVEGALIATIHAQAGFSRAQIREELKEASAPKF